MKKKDVAKPTLEEKAKARFAELRTKIKDKQLKEDIAEFLEAGEWALALDVMNDWEQHV